LDDDAVTATDHDRAMTGDGYFGHARQRVHTVELDSAGTVLGSSLLASAKFSSSAS
jgi:hypothetical protein